MSADPTPKSRDGDPSESIDAQVSRSPSRKFTIYNKIMSVRGRMIVSDSAGEQIASAQRKLLAWRETWDVDAPEGKLRLRRKQALYSYASVDHRRRFGRVLHTPQMGSLTFNGTLPARIHGGRGIAGRFSCMGQVMSSTGAPGKASIVHCTHRTSVAPWLLAGRLQAADIEGSANV